MVLTEFPPARYINTWANTLNICDDLPIMLALCLMFCVTYYAQSYACIMHSTIWPGRQQSVLVGWHPQVAKYK